MTGAAILFGIGLSCGFFLRLPGFIAATCLVLLAYAVILTSSELSGEAVATNVILGLLLLQCGYFAAVALRIAMVWARGVGEQRDGG
jgi:hypothetical protein